MISFLSNGSDEHSQGLLRHLPWCCKGHPAASAGKGFAPVMLLNGSLSTRSEEILLITVTTKFPDSWLLLRSSSSSDLQFTSVAGTLPMSWLLDKSSSTIVLHNWLNLFGIWPMNLPFASFNLFSDGKSPMNRGMKPDKYLFPDMSSVLRR